MLTLNDGRKELYQWDTGRTATVNIECDIVHFSNLKYGESLAVEVKEGEVAIPNKLLMSSVPIYCWAVVKDESGLYTKKEQTFTVIKRAKPSDYVYTETEVITIKTAVENALQEAKESGEFKGEKGDTGATGPMGPQGETGATGAAGANGTSVTVSSVSESTADGGENIVTFSDGKALTVKNGSKGSQGVQGIKGNNGTDGVSPTVEIEAITGGTKVTINDKNGAHDFNVMNGVDGADGKSAYSSAQDGGFTGTEEQFNKGLSVMGGVSGIDTTVTQNSGNLITSGAVYEYTTSAINRVRHYGARWNKTQAQMVRLYDAAAFPTTTTNFGHFGSVNANYSNPFDSIYPWSGIRLCNIDLNLYANLDAGDSITKCVKAWEGDVDFSYEDENGVWRYRPEFYGKSWEDSTYRYFDVSEMAIGSYVHYPEAIVGRWHGRAVTLTVGEAEKTCLVPSVGMPAKHIAMSTLHTYAKNYGATIDSIFSIDADVLLCIVEFATMNTQKAIGNGVMSMYRQSSDLIAEDATNSNVVKVLASAASAYCIPGAIFDIGTSDGGVQVGSYHVVSVQPNIGDAQYLDVTLNEAVTVTAANYWSVHGIINVADEEIGSKSGYIGTNGKCNSYYRGLVLFGNMFLYTLGVYENCKDQHIWIANSDEEADNYDALNTSVHYDTGLVLPGTNGYTKKLGMLSRSGLLSIPVFCTEIGGDSNNPTGDYFYNGVYAYNTVLLRGGGANSGSSDGAFYGSWNLTASYSNWYFAARPRLKNP